jgi:hypothetical protein
MEGRVGAEDACPRGRPSCPAASRVARNGTHEGQHVAQGVRNSPLRTLFCGGLGCHSFDQTVLLDRREGVLLAVKASGIGGPRLRTGHLELQRDRGSRASYRGLARLAAPNARRVPASNARPAPLTTRREVAMPDGRSRLRRWVSPCPNLASSDPGYNPHRPNYRNSPGRSPYMSGSDRPPSFVSS